MMLVTRSSSSRHRLVALGLAVLAITTPPHTLVPSVSAAALAQPVPPASPPAIAQVPPASPPAPTPPSAPARPARPVAPAQPVPPPPPPTTTAEDADATDVIRVYPVGDLISPVTSFPSTSAITPPDKLKQKDAAQTRPRKPEPSRAVQDVVDLISYFVDGLPLGNASPRMQSFGDAIVISATPAQHAYIETILTQLRARLGPTRVLQVELRFITLSGQDAATLLPPHLATSKPVLISDDLLAKLAPYTAKVVVTGYTGQTLSIATGRARQTITAVAPVVGTQAIGYESEATLVLTGISAELSATLSPDGKLARLSLSGSHSAPPPPPAAPPSSAVTAPPPGEPRPETFETQIYQFSASLQLPLNTPTLLASSSADPTSIDPTRQILIVARITDQTP